MLLCAAVTRALGIVAVTVNVHDGDFWSMEVLRSGALIDRFSPWGDYFSEDEVTAAADRLKFQGDPAAVASVLECPVEVLKPYYRYVGDQAVGKAVPGDEFPLEDFWVFTDIWRRFGASYPTNPEVFAARARFARRFTTRLPTWNGEPLGDPAA